MTKINAVVLAGDNKKDFAQIGVMNKALLSIHGKPMVGYVVDALRDSSLVGRISITGPEDLLKPHLGSKADYYAGDRNSIIDNIEAGITPFINDPAVLVVTSDIPMISGEMITDFVQQSFKQGGDFCYPIVEKGLNEKYFPDAERTYVHLVEGTFTGGNVIFLNPDIIEPCQEFAKNMIKFRKRPWKTARLLGARFLFGLLFGTLSIADIEEYICSLLQIKAAAIVADYPEICNDVDKLSDVRMVEQHFETK